jgi:hypothetical protein
MRTCKVSSLTPLTVHLEADGDVGEYKSILQLVGILSHGKVAKKLTDRAVDLMQDVQNLRRSVFECVYIRILPGCADIFQ